MKPTVSIKATVWEGSLPLLLARLETQSGFNKTPIVQSDVAAISLKVFSNTGQVGSTVAISVATVIFNVLQTGTIWDVDDIGFNFAYHLDGATYLPAGDQDYTAEFTLTMASGASAFLVFDLATKNLRSR